MPASAAPLQTIGRPPALKAELRGEIRAKQPRWLTEVVATVVHAERGTAKVLAAELGESIDSVYDAADINSPRPVKAWWIPTICKVTGSVAVLQAIAQQVGCVVFRLPVATYHQDIELVTHTAKVVQEFGEALAQVSASIADGTITPVERQRIDVEIQDVHCALETLRLIVAARAA